MKKLKAIKGPVFKHDCEKCQYLFSAKIRGWRGKRVDFYFCPNDLKEWVARFSDDPSDYTTHLWHAAQRLNVSSFDIVLVAQKKSSDYDLINAIRAAVITPIIVSGEGVVLGNWCQEGGGASSDC